MQTCFRSSLRRAISAAFSSFDKATVGWADEADDGFFSGASSHAPTASQPVASGIGGERLGGETTAFADFVTERDRLLLLHAPFSVV